MRRAFLKFVHPVVETVKNYWFSYRGAERWSADRGFVPGWVQDARFDASQVTRLELVRKARSFERNSGIFNRLIDVFEQFTTGHNGLKVVPGTEDRNFAELQTEVWEEWQRVCDLASKQHFGVLQSQVARRWFVDGEIFILKTRGDGIPGVQAPRPRIQLIETQRVDTPSAMAALEGKTIIEGIEIDDRGRPIAYWIRDGWDDQNFKRYDASQVIHVFEPERPGQYRGLPFVYAVINDLIDLDDLQILEMRAAKDLAEKSTIILNEAGEEDDQNKRRAKFSTVTQTSNGTEINQERLGFYRKILGGRTIALKKGEDVKQFIPERPSVVQQQYWDLLLSKICIGMGIPKICIIPPTSGQGTVVRADLDIANAFFRARSSVLGGCFVGVWLFVMGWSIDNDPRLKKKPADWQKNTVRPPRAVNVDVGRNSTALIAELDAGVRTYEMVYGELGLDAYTQLRAKAKEAAYIKALAKEFEVNPDDIAERIKISAGKGGGSGSGTDAPDASTN